MAGTPPASAAPTPRCAEISGSTGWGEYNCAKVATPAQHRTDLLSYARSGAAEIARPGSLAFLQALIGARDVSDERRAAPLLQRAEQFQAMLDRARDRGEPALHYTAVGDGILAPLYLRYLLGMGIDEPHLELLVDRTLTSTTTPNEH